MDVKKGGRVIPSTTSAFPGAESSSLPGSISLLSEGIETPWTFLIKVSFGSVAFAGSEADCTEETSHPEPDAAVVSGDTGSAAPLRFDLKRFFTFILSLSVQDGMQIVGRTRHGMRLCSVKHIKDCQLWNSSGQETRHLNQRNDDPWHLAPKTPWMHSATSACVSAPSNGQSTCV